MGAEFRQGTVERSGDLSHDRVNIRNAAEQNTQHRLRRQLHVPCWFLFKPTTVEGKSTLEAGGLRASVYT